MSTSRRLSQLLLSSHIGLVLLFAVLLLATGVGTIRSAIVAQALTEAERVTSESRRQLQQWQRELTVVADLLAEQPTLRFYLQRGQLTKARKLVSSFHATSNIDYIRVVKNGRTISELGPAPPSFSTGLAFDKDRTAWRVVYREINAYPNANIVIAEKLGDRLAVQPATELITVELQPLIRNTAGSKNPWVVALSEVSSSGEADTFETISGRF